jgi:hypothetical protein
VFQKMKAIVVREPYISLILRGEKTWEMRSTRTLHRGLVGLIRKGSGQVFGVANVVDSLPPLSSKNYAEYEPFHRVAACDQAGAILSRWVYPWVLANVCRLARPVPYKHAGGVAWVNLDEEIARHVLEQTSQQGTVR